MRHAKHVVLGRLLLLGYLPHLGAPHVSYPWARWIPFLVSPMGWDEDAGGNFATRWLGSWRGARGLTINLVVGDVYAYYWGEE